MVNVVLGTFLNILYWILGYLITYEMFNTLKDVFESLDADLQSHFLGITIVIALILLVVYTYMVYKFGWYEKIF